MNRFYDKLDFVDAHFLLMGTANLINEKDDSKPIVHVEYPEGPCYPATLTILSDQAQKLEPYYD